MQRIDKAYQPARTQNRAGSQQFFSMSLKDLLKPGLGRHLQQLAAAP